LRFCCPRSLYDEIGAAESRPEGPFDTKIKTVLRNQLDGVANPCEGNEAAQLMEAVGTPSQNLQGEVELGPGDVAKRVYCEVFWSVLPGPAAALVWAVSSSPDAIFPFSVSI